jgi:hypothetical protein
METKTKFNIGDKVILLRLSKAYFVEIEDIRFICGEPCYKVKLKHKEFVRESELFSSREELIEYIFS